MISYQLHILRRPYGTRRQHDPVYKTAIYYQWEYYSASVDIVTCKSETEPSVKCGYWKHEG